MMLRYTYVVYNSTGSIHKPRTSIIYLELPQPTLRDLKLHLSILLFPLCLYLQDPLMLIYIVLYLLLMVWCTVQ